MSIEETDTIDIVASRPDGTVILIVTDHLEWGDDEHLFALQQKLNSYIAYVETGQVRDLEGVTEETHIVVEVIARHEPDEAGKEFLFRVGEIMARAGIPLTWKVAP